MPAPFVLQRIADLLRRELRELPAVIELREVAHGKAGESAAVTLRKEGPAVVLRFDGFTPRRCSRPNCECTFSVDERLFPLFQAVPGVRALCDYIIFYQRHREHGATPAPLYVFLCELKSKNVGGSRGQLENSMLLAEYIVSMVKYHRRVQADLRVVYRGLLFSSNVPPQKTAVGRTPVKYVVSSERLAGLKLIHYPCGSEWTLSHFCDEP
ncbi:hypothetical protein [Sorangium sp. So ce854]|uniref:hypothetical protein n=1 Tax=Sorangium sp. So ce854 TaxID=3133322 RepID=UPI003F61ED45